ncbi:MAG TPA: ABC transporter permease subunit [Gaiellaceae bacterium]
MSEATIRAEPSADEQGAPPEAWFGLRRYAVTAAFLAPAFILLGVWVVYPAVYTIFRSFYGQADGDFVGIDNYKALFTTPAITTAIKNNAIWVAVVPAMITAIGLIFAVLIEKISWSLAFKTAVFMPMAISLFAAGVIWRIMDRQEPGIGAVNAVIGSVHDAFSPPGPLSDALTSTPNETGSPSQGIVLKTPLQPGKSVALLGLTGIPPDQVPSGAKQAVQPEPAEGAITGVVWRDFKPGGGVPGKVEQGELGLPDVKVFLRDDAGKKVASATTEGDGTFSFTDLEPGTYRAGIDAATFRKPFGGVAWLGSKLITPSIIIAYIWVWAGFAMVVIAAGLAAIPRDTLEAARTDGASEWQVFRRVTVPLLSPVLTVVFITMVINVLKVFDIVLSVAPESSQAEANVIALAMWRTAFPQSDFGLGSAIAVFLFILVIPVLLLNIRRFRREG